MPIPYLPLWQMQGYLEQKAVLLPALADRLQLLKALQSDAVTWVNLGEVSVHTRGLLVLANRVVSLAEKVVRLEVLAVHCDQLLQRSHRLFGLAAGEVVAGDDDLLLHRLWHVLDFEAILHELLAQRHLVSRI